MTYFSLQIGTFAIPLRNGAEILAEELKDRLNENSESRTVRIEQKPVRKIIESGNTEENSNGGLVQNPVNHDKNTL